MDMRTLMIDLRCKQHQKFEKNNNSFKKLLKILALSP